MAAPEPGFPGRGHRLDRLDGVEMVDRSPRLSGTTLGASGAPTRTHFPRLQRCFGAGLAKEPTRRSGSRSMVLTCGRLEEVFRRRVWPIPENLRLLEPS